MTGGALVEDAFITVCYSDHQRALALLQSELDAIGDAGTLLGANDDAIDDNIDRLPS